MSFNTGIGFKQKEEKDNLGKLWSGFNDAKSVLQKLEHRMDATDAQELGNNSLDRFSTRFQNVTFREPPVNYNEEYNPFAANQSSANSRNQSVFIARDLRNADDSVVSIPRPKIPKQENAVDHNMMSEGALDTPDVQGTIIPPRVLNECTNDLHASSRTKSPGRDLTSAGVARVIPTSFDHDKVYKFLHREKTEFKEAKPLYKPTIVFNTPQSPYKLVNMSKQRKKLEQDPSSLARLKQKIERQKMGCSPGSLDSSSLTSQSHSKAESIDMVKSKPLDRQFIRKTAQGPTAPKYKGFNTAETRIQTQDGMVWGAGSNPHDGTRKYRSSSARPVKNKVAFKPTNENKRSHSANIGISQARHNTTKTAKHPIRKTGKIESKSNKSIITPASWKEGQRLAESILGPPPKQPKKTAPSSPPTRDTNTTNQKPVKKDNLGDNVASRLDEIAGKTEPQKSMKQKTAKIPTATLSAEVKEVLHDLHLSSSDSEPEASAKDPQKPSAVSVRSPKGRGRTLDRKHKLEEKKDTVNVVQKLRHYKQDEVQKYIARQKADRKRRIMEAKRAQHDADTKKQQQLDDLYKKQKEAFARKQDDSKMKSRSKSPGQSNSTKPMNQQISSHELPSKYQEKIAALLGRFEGYEREAVVTMETKPLVTSHSTSRPQTTPNRSKTNFQNYTSSLHAPAHTQSTRNNLKPDITSEFVQKLDKYLKDDIVLGSSVRSDPSNLEVNDLSSPKHDPELNTDARTLEASFHGVVKEPTKTRAERLAALREQVDSLQDKLANQSRALLNPGFRALVPPTSKIEEILAKAKASPRKAWEEPGVDVPDSSMPYPGVASLKGHSDKVKENDAAITIQSAYRGHRVRKAMDTWELPSGNTMSDVIRNRPHDGDRASSQHEDLSARSTASSNQPIKLRTVDEILRDLGKREFCASDSPRKPTWEEHLSSNDQSDDQFFRGLEMEIEQRQSARTDPLLQNNDVPPWERTGGDKYSVVNIFTKRYMKNLKRDSEKRQNDFETSKTHHQAQDVNKGHDFKDDHPLNSEGQISTALDLSEITNIKDSFYNDCLKSDRSITESHHTHSSRTNDTLASSRAIPRSPKQTKTSLELEPTKSVVKAPPSNTTSPRSNISSCSTSIHSSKEADDDGLATQWKSRGLQTTVPLEKRFSPAALQMKLTAELNYQEAMDESLRHLTGVQRMQGVSLAQQETVSMAQILKARQLQHEVELERLTIKAKEEAVEAERVKVAEQLKKDKEFSKQIQETATKNLETQEKIARMTARAADKLTSALDHDESSYTRDESPSSHDSSSTVTNGTFEDRSVKGDDEDVSSPCALDLAPKRSPPSLMSEHSTTSVRTSDDTIPENIDNKITGGGSESSRSQPEEIIEDLQFDDASNSDSQASATPRATVQTPPKTRKMSPNQASSEYSMQFDESLTEDEMAEISRRALVPSEIQRRHQRRHASPHTSLDRSDVSVSSDDQSVRRKHSSHSLFEDTTEESDYAAFMTGIVREYVMQDEMRSKHQAAMLKLRERALKEKTRAELKFVEQQKRLLRNKGEDDKMPPLQKKKRQILRRWHVKSEEIKKLKAMQTAADQNRKMLLQQDKEIGRIRQTTQQIKDKMREKDTDSAKSSPRFKKPEDGALVTSSTPVAELENIPMSEGNSDIDISSSSSSSVIKSLISRFPVVADERKLTKREQRLAQRRTRVEQLLKWQQKLDEEERAVSDLEKHIKLDKLEKSDYSKTKSDKKSSNEKPASNSESSIAEEIVSSASSPTNEQDKTPRKIDVTGDTVTDDRTQDIATKSSVAVPTKTSPVVTDEKSDGGKNKLTEKTQSDSTTRLLPSPGTSSPQTKPAVGASESRGRKESIESWSDESFSQTQSETEHSDIECRVRALKEELNRRKCVADRLKKQQKRREKERLRAQEASLRGQLETLDCFIRQTQNEINRELEGGSAHDAANHIHASKPQIRSPRKNDQSRQTARNLRSAGTVSPEASPRSGSQRHTPASVLTKPRTESESSGKSSRSLSFDDEGDRTPDDVTTPLLLNGSKPFVEALPSRRTPQEAKLLSPNSAAPSIEKSERPKKLDLPTTKKESTSPTPTSKIPQPSKISKPSDKTPPKSGESPTTSSESSKPSSQLRRSGIPVAKNSKSPPVPVKLKPASPSTSEASLTYSEDFEVSASAQSKKDEDSHSSTVTSIKTEEDISERLSEESLDRNDASMRSSDGSSVMFDLDTGSKKNNVEQESVQDDKTPVVTPRTPEKTFSAEDISAKSISEESDVKSELSRAISEAEKSFEAFASEVITEPEPAQPIESKQRLAEELSEKLLKSLLEDTVTDALVVKKDKESEIKEETNQEEQPELTESTKNLLELLSESPDHKQENLPKDHDELAESFTGNLLHHTIDKVLEIRKERTKKWSQDVEPEQKSPQRDIENGREVADILQSTQEGVESGGEAETSEREPSVVRPVSPIFGTGAHQDEPTEEWLDDDFGISSFHKQTPPIVEKDQALASEKWMEGHVIEVASNRYEPPPVKHHVPHKTEHILRHVEAAVSYMYDLQEKGQLSNDVAYPVDVFADVVSESDSANSGDDDSTKSEDNRANKLIFKNSLFDLVKEIVCDIYMSQNTTSDIPVWQKSSRKPRPVYCRKIPSDRNELCTIVREQVSKLMNLHGETYKLDPKTTMKWGAKKKKDKVDLILIQELREEEPDWTNYDVDEASVKLQLADTVLDMLLTDTIQCLNGIDKLQPEVGASEQDDERSQ